MGWLLCLFLLSNHIAHFRSLLHLRVATFPSTISPCLAILKLFVCWWSVILPLCLLFHLWVDLYLKPFIMVVWCDSFHWPPLLIYFSQISCLSRLFFISAWQPSHAPCLQKRLLGSGSLSVGVWSIQGIWMEHCKLIYFCFYLFIFIRSFICRVKWLSSSPFHRWFLTVSHILPHFLSPLHLRMETMLSSVPSEGITWKSFVFCWSVILPLQMRGQM